MNGNVVFRNFLNFTNTSCCTSVHPRLFGKQGKGTEAPACAELRVGGRQESQGRRYRSDKDAGEGIICRGLLLPGPRPGLADQVERRCHHDDI